MTKKLFMLIVAFVCAATMAAQNIAVVSPSGVTTLYNTFPEAVEGAEDGSVVYLPGGRFVLSNALHITKKLTIVGIGHKSESPDGITYIDGFIYFEGGSSGSALMGCYLDDAITIYSEVNDITIRHNRIYSVSTGGKRTFINQNYISYVYGNLGSTSTNASDISITHNVVYSVQHVYDGNISNNILLGTGNNPFHHCQRSTITDNIITSSSPFWNCSDNYISGNLMATDYEDNINIGSVNWSDVFVNYNTSDWVNSDYHLKGDFQQYEDQVGIYAGSGFDDKQLAPVPYIVAKKVDDQTDAQGKLNIKVRVKAGDAE